MVVSIVALVGLPSRALGDGTGVIVAPSSGARGDRAALAGALADATAGRSGRVIPDAVAEARATHAAGAVPIEVLARFRRVRAQIDEGWRAYLRVAVEVAAQRLAAARTDAESLVALPGGAELYADAALRLGAVLGHLGRDDDARAVLRLALALDPDRPVTVAEFSPDIVERVEAARAAEPGIQRLAIVSTPAGAAIELDGRAVGRAPIAIDVARGQHLVVARAAGHQPVVQGVAVGDRPAEVALVLDLDVEAARLAAGAAPPRGAADQQQLVDAVLRYADLDEVIVGAVTWRRGAPALIVQRCAGQPARCSAVVDVGFEPGGQAAAARAAWQAARAGELRYPPSVLAAPRGEPERRERGCAACRSPWLWTGIGAAVVAGAVITLVVTSGSRPPPVVGIDPGQYIDR